MEIIREKNEFYVLTNNGKAYIRFKVFNGKIDLYETFVPEKERGKGIAKTLTLEALKFAKENKLKVIPSCPYVKDFIEKNPEWKEIVE